jgi:ribosome-binding factor A
MKRRHSAHPGAARSGSQAGGPAPDVGPSQRQLRVGEELRHALAQIVERAHFRDPVLQDVSVTFTEVRVSPDLKSATAFVTPLGGVNVTEVVAALRRAAPYFRGQIARAVKLRVVPNLFFEPDTSFDYASKIAGLLHQPDVARDLENENDDTVAADARDEDGDRRHR